jgi:hypothetical protein
MPMVTELQIDANSGDFRDVTAAASLKLERSAQRRQPAPSSAQP